MVAEINKSRKNRLFWVKASYYIQLQDMPEIWKICHFLSNYSDKYFIQY